MSARRRRVNAFLAAWGTAAIVPAGGLILAQTPEGRGAPSGAQPATPERDLREDFSGRQDISKDARTVGRLGLLLVGSNDRAMLVPVDYKFRTGDIFRFEVTASRPGWLYVLHESPKGKVQQLWPRGKELHELQAGQPYVIPPSPARFVFNNEIGQELFYVAIRPDPTPPLLGDELEPLLRQPTATESDSARPRLPTAKITNSMIRDPFRDSGRAVLFDPGTDDADRYLYFSTVPGAGVAHPKVQFKLQHGD